MAPLDSQLLHHLDNDLVLLQGCVRVLKGGRDGDASARAVCGSFLFETTTYNHNKLRPVELRPWYVLPCNLLTTPRLYWVRYTGARRVPDGFTFGVLHTLFSNTTRDPGKTKPVTHYQPPQLRSATPVLEVHFRCPAVFQDFQLQFQQLVGDGCSCSDRRRRGKVGGSAGRPTRLSAPCHICDRYHRVGLHTPDWMSVLRCRRDSALASTVQYGDRSVRLR